MRNLLTFLTCALPVWFLCASLALPAEKVKPKKLAMQFKDTAGNMVNIASLKGKFVHIDMWASWCRPCIEEFEATKKLQNQFDTADIHWVFISFDKDEKTWKNAIAKHKLKGLHLYGTPVKEQLKKEFSIAGIPYYIWIDAEGDILVEDAPRPTSGIAKQLKQYIKL